MCVCCVCCAVKKTYLKKRNLTTFFVMKKSVEFKTGLLCV